MDKSTVSISGTRYKFLLTVEESEFSIKATHLETSFFASVTNVNGISSLIKETIEELFFRSVSIDNSAVDLDSYLEADFLLDCIHVDLQQNPNLIQQWEYYCDEDRRCGEWEDLEI